MKSPKRNFLFLEAASFKPLAIFRIGIAAILLAQVQVLWRYRDLLMDEFGPVPWVLSDRLLDPLLPRLSYVTAWLAPYGVSSGAVVTAFLAMHTIAVVLLAAGYRTRIAAIAAWATYLPLRYAGHLYFYGIGGMLLIGLFYCMFLPVGREWSLDSRREIERGRVQPQAHVAVAVVIERPDGEHPALAGTMASTIVRRAMGLEFLGPGEGEAQFTHRGGNRAPAPASHHSP